MNSAGAQHVFCCLPYVLSQELGYSSKAFLKRCLICQFDLVYHGARAAQFVFFQGEDTMIF